MAFKNKKLILKFLIFAIILIWPFFLKTQLEPPPEPIPLEEVTLDPPLPGCFGSEAFVNLSWTSTISGTPTYFILRRLSTEKTFTEIGSTTSTSYSDSTILSDKNYYYKIKAVRGTDVFFSNEELALASYCPPVLYSPTTSCLADGPRINLSWSSVSGSLSTYEIYRDGTKIAQTTSTNFSDGPGIEATKIYNYFIKAIWQDGTATSSETVSAIAPTCPPTLNISADCLSISPGGPKVDLSWNSLLGVQNYQIYRKAQAETEFSLLKITTSTSYVDKLVETLSAYYEGGQISYYVKAIWETDQASSDTKQTEIPRCPPFLEVETNCDELSYRLSWTATRDATKYNIYKEGAFYYQNLGITNTSFTDSICEEKICTTTYQVIAIDTGVNLPSNSVEKFVDCLTITPPSPAPVLDTPQAYCVAGDSKVKLNWTPSENLLYYGVYRNNVNIVNLYETSYEDSGVESGIDYNYWIVAYGKGGTSTTSNSQIITAVDCTPPSKPTLTLSTGCETGIPYINLSWSSTTNTFSYEIWGGTTTNLTLWETVDKTVLIRKYTGLLPSTTYYFKIVAKGPTGVPPTTSDIETIATQSCLPTTPDLYKLERFCEAGAPRVKLYWSTDAANTQFFEIFRRKEGEASPTLVATISDTTKRDWTDNDPSLLQETLYYYKVDAVGYLAGQRTSSGEKSITTYNCLPPGPFTLTIDQTYCRGSYPWTDLSWTESSNANSYDLYQNRLNPDGTIAETTIFSNVTSPFIDRGFGNALDFDGYYDYVNVPNSESLNPAQITLEAWVYPTAFNPYANIFSKRSPEQYILRFYSNTGRVQGYAYIGGAWRACTTPSAIAAKLKQWNHIVFTYDGTAGRVYVNGVEGCTFSYTGNIAGGTSPLRIGSERFKGRIDQARIYNRALSPSEVLEHYQGIYSNETGLVGLWHFDEGSGQIVSDSSNYGNNGTLGPSNAAETADPTWIKNGPQINTNYTWQIKAIGPGGETLSNIVGPNLMSICSPTKPGLVLTTFCQAGTGLPAVTLRWSYSIHTVNYEIYRQDEGLIATTSQTVDPAGRTFIDSGLDQEKSYTYYIRAIGPTGLSNQSDSISITTPNCLAPTKPENLTATFSCSNSNPQVNLSWDASKNADYYTVYREPLLFPFPVSTATTSYTDTAVRTGSTYSYYVIAYGPGGSSPPSDSVTITTGFCTPSTPSIKFLTTDCEGFVPVNTIFWSDPDVEARQIFYDSFESGDFSKWGGRFQVNGTLSIESIDPQHGTYHSQFVSDSVNPIGYGGSYINIPGTHTFLYARAYYKFDSLPSADGSEYIFTTMHSPQTSNLAQVKLRREGGEYFWRITFKGVNIDSPTFTPEINKWYSIELYVKVNSIAGEAKLWVDGELKASTSTIDASADSQISRVDIWVYKNDVPGKRTYRMDFAIVSNSYIGPGVPIYNADKYKIYRNTTGNLPTEADLIKTINIADIEFLERNWKDNINLENKKTYYYWVKSVGPTGLESSFSTRKEITTYFCDIPSAPSLTHTPPYCKYNLPYVDLNWTTDPNAYSYNLYRINPDNSLSTYSTRISPLTDKGSYALRFDGVNDFVEIPNHDSLNVKSITIEMWVKQIARHPSTWTHLLSKGEGWLGSYYVLSREIGNVTRILFTVKVGGSNYQLWATKTLELNTWTHLVFTYDASTGVQRIYWNGQLDSWAARTPGEIDTNTGPLRITGFNGVIDEVRIYGRALSPSEVNEHYQGIYKNEAELRGVWHFDEGERTTIFDSSGKGNHGRIAGPEWVSGKIAGGLEFGGLNGYVNVPDNPTLDLSQELTVEAWFNIDSIPPSGLKTIISKDENFELHINSAGRIYWRWQNSAGIHRSQTGNTVIVPGNWYHVAIVYSKSKGIQAIYLNGNLDSAVGTLKEDLRLNDDPLQIASGQGVSGRFFNGKIDEVRIYNRALSATEVLEHYNGIFTDETGLVGLWHFDEGSGGIAYDDSPFGNDGTLIRGAQWIRPSDAPASVYVPPLEREKTYKYYVKSVGVKVESSASNEISFTSLPCLPAKPILNATPSCQDTNPQIILSWQPDPNTAYWSIYKRKEGETWKQLLNTTQISYTDGNIESGAKYEYYVRAIGYDPNFTQTSDLVSITAPFCYPKPYGGISFSITSATSVCYGYSTRIVIEWPSDPTGNTISYNIWRKNITAGETDFSTTSVGLSATVTRFVDIVSETTTYVYKVEAVGSGEGNTLFSYESDEITSLACSQMPPNPPVLTLDGWSSTGDLIVVWLHWTDAGNEEYYGIWRKGSDWQEIATTSGKEIPENTYWYNSNPPDTTLIDGKTYEYKIVAYNANGSTESNTISVDIPIAKPGSFTLCPFPPVSCFRIGNTIHLAWTEAATTPSGGTVTYTVLRDDNIDFTSPTILGSTTNLEWDDTSPLINERFYKIKATNNGGSTYSNVWRSGLPLPRWREIPPY